MYRKNTASQFVCFQMLLTATGAVATGLSPAVRRCIDGSFAAGGGTVTEDGTTGSYKYAMSQADTNGNNISFIFSAATAIPVCVNIVTTAADPTSAASFGLTNLDAAITSRMATYTQPTGFLAATFPTTVASTTNITAGTITTVSGNVTGSVGSVTGLTASDVGSIKTKTDFLPSATAGSAGGVFIAGTNAATVVTTSFTTTFTGNLTGNVGGNVSGTIGGLTAAALADFFDTDSTTTYASAVAGSVVKEIVDNSGGTPPTAADIADAVWDEDATAHQTQGTFGQAIGDPVADADTIWGLVNTNLNATVSSRATQTSVDDLPTNAELATALGTADDAVLAAVGALSIPTANQNADALLDRTDAIETGLTPRQAMRLSAAADGGKLSGGATATNTIRNAVADSKDRIIATVDADGNRTAITYDLT